MTPIGAQEVVEQVMGLPGGGMDELDNYDLTQSGDYEDTTVGDVHESIETNVWLSEAYVAAGALGLAKECLAAVRGEMRRFGDVLVPAQIRTIKRRIVKGGLLRLYLEVGR